MRKTNKLLFPCCRLKGNGYMDKLGDDCVKIVLAPICNGEITVSNLFLSPSEKGSILKGKNLLPMGANSFLLK